MRLLLDTHIWLWSLLDPGRLSPRIIRELENLDNELWLSPISVWETLILGSRGRIDLGARPIDWVRLALTRVPLKEAVLNHEVAMQSVAVDTAQGDPADRFLAATAIVHALTLVTSDEKLLACRNLPLLPNR